VKLYEPPPDDEPLDALQQARVRLLIDLVEADIRAEWAREAQARAERAPPLRLVPDDDDVTP
jgi:hypothetical protein